MHLDLICLLFLSDCSLIIAMLKQLTGSPKIYSSRWGWGGKDEEVENGQPGGFWAAAKEGYRAARAGGWHCPGPFILMALPPKDGMTVWKWLPGSPVTVFWKTAQAFLQRNDGLTCDPLCWLEYVDRKTQTPHCQKSKRWNSTRDLSHSCLSSSWLLSWDETVKLWAPIRLGGSLLMLSECFMGSVQGLWKTGTLTAVTNGENNGWWKG